jgi:predicted CopG family antitoxin
MRHERIITQSGLLNTLRTFHRLSNEKSKNSISDVIIEIVDKEVLENIQVPMFIENLALESKLSIQDMISCILRCFMTDYTCGRVEYNKSLLSHIKDFPMEDSLKIKLVAYLTEQVGKQNI